ncbi:MAG: N-6 DNA methylase [Bacteroidales bacterium]|nr:N-6 DNA methylase [Bacteroidales bacterium]
MDSRIQQKAAKDFSQLWKDRGYEKGESQPFWLGLLRDVFAIDKPELYIRFESQVKLDHTSFIDGYIRATHVLIEQKSIDKDLRAPIKQSDGTLLNPFQQAKRYSADLPYSERPRWIVTCNFKSFLIYDMEQPNSEPEEVLLENLEKEYYRLSFLVDSENIHIKKEMEVSLKAGEIIGKIYDELLKQYIDKDEHSLRSLNILCVRLVFCLYAEDAGIFSSHNIFHDYLSRFEPGHGDMREALIKLFEVLDTPLDKRDKYMRPELKAFPYCNGGLFSEKDIEIPFFNDRIAQLLLDNASSDFDWSEISPTIFGSVFESTLNQETRRKGGMHYTSIENIHKVIDPLFLDDLKQELDQIRDIPIEKQRMSALTKYQDKLASLTFLDPACGSGNFLTESYLSLRRLENKAIAELHKGQITLGFDDEHTPVKVGIHQFYGIEINDFAVDVATTALWIAESQMLKETQGIIKRELDMLPLKTYRNILRGNALRMNWEEIIPKEKLNYIVGNPPFIGARWMDGEQKEDVIDTFGKNWQGVGDLDYVCCWFKKATDYIINTDVKCAFVSTNSITQGGSVANLWKPLFENNILINFAWRTFRWNSESSGKAHVHCVIVGFSTTKNNKAKVIFLNDKQIIEASNINGYLFDAPNVFIEKRMLPLSNVPQICLGGQPIDDGNLILTEEEKNELLEKEPIAVQFIRHYMMGKDFIERKPRYCLWLQGAAPSEIKKCPEIIRRIERVREFRLASKRTSTLRAADNPTLFGAPFECTSDYVAIPKVSSENRRYIPIDYLSKEIIPGDKLFVMQQITQYHFGVLTSNVHMCWMRAVCGRLKSDYSYSNTIVYNNFPWPEPTETQKNKIEETAQAILDARNLYPNSSLADLYDEVLMPPELRKAHQENDKAVMAAYGFSIHMSESECVAELMKMYQKLTNNK